MDENWVQLWGTDPSYLVSNLGRVASCRPKTLRENGGQPFVMRPQLWKTSGYKFVKIHGKATALSSIVYYSFNPDAPKNSRSSGLEINHRDGNKENNSLSNLELISLKENRRHRTYILGVPAWNNPAIKTTITVQATGEIITFPSRRALFRSFKPSEVIIHGN